MEAILAGCMPSAFVRVRKKWMVISQNLWCLPPNRRIQKDERGEMADDYHQYKVRVMIITAIIMSIITAIH